MSETTQDLLRRGLEIVDSYAVWQSDVVGVGHDAEALRAVAAVVRRELEAPATGEDVRERVAREIREAAWADPTGLRERQNAEALADRILALLGAPRGEGEGGTWGDTPFAAFVVWWQGRLGAAWVNPRVWCYTRADKAREAAKRLKENGVPVALAVAPAALRSEAQGRARSSLVTESNRR